MREESGVTESAHEPAEGEAQPEEVIPTNVEEYKAKKAQEEPPPEKLSLWLFPDLEREQRVDLVKRLQDGAEWNFSFGLLTVLSTAIASFGLIQGSTAVVIGAMVVAPLMMPLIAQGLALVQGNVVLFKRTIITMFWGVVCALLASIIIGLITPFSDISTELLARAAPNVLDLAIAYLSGFAAAYAVALPQLLGALAGVAIAVALVPPLAATGIGFADGIWVLAEGAGILFLSNMVAIVLGSATVFYCFGISKRGDQERDVWFRRTILVLISLTVMLGAILTYKMRVQLSEGQARPANYPLTQRVKHKIRTYLEPHRNIRFMQGSRSLNSRGELRVTLYLSSNRAVESDFRPNFEQYVQSLFSSDPNVEIYILQEVAGSEAVSYTATPEGEIKRE